ncbi:unnamed protein product [Parajaminaea phylloscopi]
MPSKVNVLIQDMLGAVVCVCLVLAVAPTALAASILATQPEIPPTSAFLCHNTSYACVMATYSANVNPDRSVIPWFNQFRRDGVQGWVVNRNDRVRVGGTCTHNDDFLINIDFDKGHYDIPIGRATCELHPTTTGKGMEAIIDCP